VVSATLRGVGWVQGSIQLDAWGRAEKVLAAGGGAKEVVQTEFDELYPGQVDFVTPVYNTDKLDATYAKYNAIHGALTDLLDDYTSKANRGKPVKRRMVRAIQKPFLPWLDCFPCFSPFSPPCVSLSSTFLCD
jgi:hypothetical protein